MAHWIITVSPALAPAVNLFAAMWADFLAEFPAYLLETLGGLL